jgi:hypothetical protein
MDTAGIVEIRAVENVQKEATVVLGKGRWSVQSIDPNILIAKEFLMP